MKILIADDDAAGRCMLETLLKGDGHEVVLAKNGLEALERLKEDGIQIIISDILMTVMDGFHFCHEVKKNDSYKNIPFIFYSAAYTDEQDEAFAIELGASAYIRKPIDPDEFLKIIKEVLAKKEEGSISTSTPAPKKGREYLSRYSERLVSLLNRKVIELNKEIGERQRAEERLKFAQVAVENHPDAIVWADPDAKLIYSNEAACRETGYSREELLHMTMRDLAPAYGKETWPEFIKKLKEVGHMTFESSVKRKNGAEYPAEVLVNYLEHKGKEYVNVSLSDISERKKSQELLAESEKKYHALVLNIPDVTWAANLKGETSFISPNVEKVYGYTADEILAGGEELWFGRIHPHDRDKVKKSYGNLFGKDERYDVEYRIKRKDGKWIWLHDRAESYVGKKGAQYAYGIFSDITERKTVEEALKESEEKMRAIADTALDAIVMIDNEAKILFWNPAAVKLFGYTKEEALGASLTDLIIPERYVEQLWKGFGSFSKTGEGPLVGKTVEMMARRKNGAEFPVSHSINRVRIAGKWAAVGLIRDMTEAKKTREMLIQSAKLASIGEIAANVAHEINNPMTAVLGYSSLIMEELDESSPYYEDIKTIEKESHRVKNIIRNLLDFARQRKAEKRMADINEILRGSISLMAHTARNANIIIELGPNEELPSLKIDADQIKQVFINMISNAIQSMPDGGRVEIVTKISKEKGSEGKNAVITFKDTGCGIPGELFNKIFEPFYSTKGEKGTGLGLSVSYGIIKNHGGDILVKSREGKGSEFKVILPVFLQTESMNEET